jgi:hypothetical protein
LGEKIILQEAPIKEEAPNAIIGLPHWDNEQKIQLNNKEDACSF